jgi:hypothetical protein
VKANDITLTVRVDDQASPVLRRLRRELWWFAHADQVIGMIVGGIILAVGILLGLLAH